MTGLTDLHPWPYTVLLGAGLSRNWGGYLAAEIWGAMMADRLMEEHDSLRHLLLSEPDFERALAEVRTRRDRFGERERSAFETVVRNAFDLQDQNLRHKLGDADDASELWNDFSEMILRPLIDTPTERQAPSFLFSLNQDLFIERALCRSQPLAPRLPGVVWEYDSSVPAPWFPKTPGRWKLDTFDATKDIAHVESTGFDGIGYGGTLNFVKLHGSYNWRAASANEDVMVLGGAKETSIARHPILTYYFDLFRHICRTKGMRLLVIGYSFRDAHINDVIADGVRSAGLKLFVIDPKPPSDLRQQLVLGRYGDIWNSVHGYVSRPISEAFGTRGRSTRSGEALQIRRAFYRGVFA